MPTPNSIEDHSHEPTQATAPGEWYERGIALRKAGLFNKAIDQFEKAGDDTAYRLKSYAQIGLCYKSADRYEEAVAAFRQALQSPAASPKSRPAKPPATMPSTASPSSRSAPPRPLIPSSNAGN